MLHVPTAYLIIRPLPSANTRTKDIHFGEKYTAFNFGIVLPDFRPASSDPASFEAFGWHNQLLVLVEHNHPIASPQVTIERLFYAQNINRNQFQVKNGCRICQGFDEIYVCEIETQPFTFTCTKPQKYLPTPSCQVREALWEQDTLTYTYSRTYVEDAVSIEIRTRALLQSFRSHSD